MLLVGIALWLEVNFHSFTKCFPGSTSLLTYPFQVFSVSNFDLREWISLLALVFPQWYSLSTVLLRTISFFITISFSALLCILIFLLHIPRRFLTLSELDTVPSYLNRDSDWISSKTVSCLRLLNDIWSDFFCSIVYLRSNFFDSLLSSIITDLNNTGQTLCLFQVGIITLLLPYIYFLIQISFCFF